MYQENVLKREQEEKEAQKKKVIDQIQPDLEKIIEAGKKLGRKELIQFVYKEYPPKNKVKVKIGNDGDMKKTYRSALINYHPDKNLADEHGYVWFFIAEQIAKELGRVYEEFCCCEDVPNSE
jgi:hypothetical protein